MTKFYISILEKDIFKKGFLIKNENEKFCIMDTKKVYKFESGIAPEFLIEVSNIKFNYLNKIEIVKRVDVHKSQLFEKIVQLKIYDKCIVCIGAQTFNVTIFRGINKDNELIGKKDQKDIKINSWDIVSVSFADFYICLVDNAGKEAGDIFCRHDNTFDNDDKCRKISRKEMCFLNKYPRKERLKDHVEKLWEIINKMVVGDRCYIDRKLDGPTYVIRQIVINDSPAVVFTLRSADGHYTEVDMSQIRPYTQKEMTDEKEIGTRPTVDGAGTRLVLDNIGGRRLVDGEGTRGLTKGGEVRPTMKEGQLVDREGAKGLTKGGEVRPTMKEGQLVDREVARGLTKGGEVRPTMKEGQLVDRGSAMGLTKGVEVRPTMKEGQLVDRGGAMGLTKGVEVRPSMKEGQLVDREGAKGLTKDGDVQPRSNEENQYMALEKGLKGPLTKEGEVKPTVKKGNMQSLTAAEDQRSTTKESNSRTSLSSLSSTTSSGSKKKGPVLINVKNVKNVERGNTDGVIERYLVINECLLARLKWKGVIDGSISIGCELNKSLDNGCNGQINGHQLFTCKDKKGAFISVDADKEDVPQTCERATGVCHNPLTYDKDNIIQMDSICCIYDDIFHQSDYDDKEIMLADGCLSKCTWSVFLNGNECVGVLLSKTSKMTGYKNEGLCKKLIQLYPLNKFDALFDVKNLPNSIRCDVNRVDIVNHFHIRSVDEGNRCNKLLSLKQGVNSLVVILRWRGRVNGLRCLGCELSKDCKYGTNGRFKDQQLFECPDKRGVLILADVNMESCESGSCGAASAGEKMHNKIETDVFILERCICCAEREDKRGSGSGINIGDEIIVKDDCHGIIKWMGLINGERSLGLELMTDGVRGGTDGTFNGMQLFQSASKKAVLVKCQGICETLMCGKINAPVINPTFIRATKLEREISAFVVIRTVDPPVTVDARWIGQVDGKDCIGCVLPVEYKYGTGGSFTGNKLFTCERRKGVLLPKESFQYGCFSKNPRHNACKKTSMKNILEESICCMECLDELTKLTQVNIGSNVTVTALRHDLIGKCAWTGLINGQETVGIITVKPIKYGTDGTFCGMTLFKSEPGSGFLYLAEDIEKIPEMNFIKDIYLENSYDISLLDKTQSVDMIGDFVYVNDTPRLYGRVVFHALLFGEKVTAIKMIKELIEKCPANALFPEDNTRDVSLIIAKLWSVNPFNDPLVTQENGGIVDIKSVKVHEYFVSDKFKKDDIVRYGVCHGKVVSSQMLNNVPCIKVVNPINETGEDAGKYVLEGAASKVSDLRSATKYHEESIIDPKSIITIKSFTDCDLCVNGEVQFRLKYSLEIFRGKILMLAVVNDIPAVVVELNLTPQNTDIAQFRINECRSFKDVVPLTAKDAVFVVANIAHINTKLISWCGKNEVSVVSPVQVKTVQEGKSFDKVVLFECKDKIVVAKLKWTGYVNGDMCIGCEMSIESIFGTSGRYGDYDLFKCAKGTGVLISLDGINACCINGPHKDLNISWDGRIAGKEVCCAETLKEDRPSTRFRVGDRVKSVTDRYNVSGTCRWVGFVNEKSAIGVDLAQCGNSVNDACVDRLALFKCAYGKAGLFLDDDFIRDPIGLCYCSTNNSFVVDPTNVLNIENGRPVHKKMVCGTDNNNVMIMDIKWTGDVNGVPCVGCEQDQECLCGTSGFFGDRRLFDSADGKGVLIPASYICDCCIGGSHGKLVTSFDGKVAGSSVCCAERLDELKCIIKWKLGDKVMRIGGRGSVFGTCLWMGLVNNEEAVGLEMTGSVDSGVDTRMDNLALFDCPSNKRGLFLSKDFTVDPVSRRYCSQNGVFVVAGDTIKSVKNDKVLKKKLLYHDVMMDIKWRGDVNGIVCVGCELTYACEYGSDVVIFGGKRLFESAADKGVLIPVDSLIGSCEHGGHKEVIKCDTYGVNGYCLCCVETLQKIEKWPQMETGSKIKFKRYLGLQEKIGKCKWMGRVNGKECVGVEMMENINLGTNGTFKHFDVFKCKDGRGVIFLSEDIEHDIKGEEIKFVEGKFVDVSKIWKCKNIEDNTVKGITIGDYVSTYIQEEKGVKRVFSGELKWIGTVFRNVCVGIDLEDRYAKGMDGFIDRKEVFKCRAQHGVVTTIDNVDRKDVAGPSFNVDGTIDANKYLRCEERWNQESMEERKVWKNGPVFVIIDNDDKGRWKRKGTLRWCGSMNGESVAVVELDEDYEQATDGLYWRHQLIKCGKKRAVAVKWHNIHEYTQFEKLSIPLDKRIFKEIDINSAVIQYVPKGDVLVSLYGTVRWSGVSEQSEYLYGLDLDDRCDRGTDGTFNGCRLFQCQNGHGVLATLNFVAPDTRFTEKKFTDEEIVKSDSAERVVYSIPVKPKRGEKCGIQGNTNSCYFDSSIFALLAKSDVLDFMIAPLKNEEEPNVITKKFREILAFNIVYPLRENGFVSFHHTQTMRDVIKDYGGPFEEMTKQETDMENVAALLAKLCPDNQLLRFRSFNDHTNTAMFLQLFVIIDKQIVNISSQQMLEISMAQSGIMFDKPPTCLIMQAPRDARGINCYQNALPSKTIEISNLCHSCYKRCSKCDSMATMQCKTCIEIKHRTKHGLFCDTHKCNHTEIVKFPYSSVHSRSEVQMELKAVICIEKAHFVTYVKEDEFKNEWVYFDSMSTQDITNNYAVPKVSFEKRVSLFMSLNVDDMENELVNYKDALLKRIVKDSYMFVYHNTSLTCY